MINEVQLFQNQLPAITEQLNEQLYEKFNILEVSGLSSQEVKHSHLLGWFIDSEGHEFCHKLLALIFQGFINEQSIINHEFQGYVNTLLQHDGDSPLAIDVHRESLGDIDILIVDRSNQVVIVIENKVWAGERTEGEDGGQLKKYENFVKARFPLFQHFFIFLTPSLQSVKGGKEYWMLGSYQAIYDVLKSVEPICKKTELLVDSYLELLVKENIVPNKQLEEICETIWMDADNRKALDTLIMYRPSELPEIARVIKEQGVEANLDLKNRLIWFDVSEAFKQQNIEVGTSVRFCIDKYEGSYWIGFYIPYDLGIKSIECKWLNKYLPKGNRTKQTLSISGDDYYNYQLVAEHFINQVIDIQKDIVKAG